MANALRIEHFPHFFEEVTSHQPFGWQTELAKQCDRDRAWPVLLDLPTGSGKTSVLEIAVFLLALEADRAATERWMPRRIAMVVDRRVIVDQAAESAHRLEECLANSPTGIVAAVAERLSSLCADEEAAPLRVAALRGGIARDNSWTRRADQPLLITSTVDQVGSRMLFQGYGVSEAMRPVHAGLLANDTLLILDEVHLSQPFAETLAAISSRLGRRGHDVLHNRWQVVHLSATPPAGLGLLDERQQVRLRVEDLGDSGADGRLRQRLTAAKPCRLVPVKVSTRDPARARADLAKACASHTAGLLGSGAQTVAVVVNRVDTARRTHALLAETGRRAVLLTGRMRDLDRERLAAALRPFVEAGRGSRSVDGEPLVVVATQCIEAGADYDFDAIVTECASLDALRQRFGRVDRLGELGVEDSAFESVVLGPSTTVESTDDPVYGGAVRATWDWLRAQAVDDVYDFGVAASMGMAAPRETAAESEATPHLLPTHLDWWSQKSIRRGAEVPDVARWLHGDQPIDTDVQVVWRADLTEGFLESRPADEVIERIAVCPPRVSEALALPISAVRAWLGGSAPLDDGLADVEGGRMPDVDERQRLRQFVVWAGEDSRVASGGRALRPGMTVVVPSTYGGLATSVFETTEYGTWSPTASDPVADLGDVVNAGVGRARVARLFPAGTLGAPATYDSAPDPFERDEAVDARNDVFAWLDDGALFGTEGMPAVNERSTITVHEFTNPAEAGVEAVSWYALTWVARRSAGLSGADTEPDTSSFTGSEAPLDQHLSGVGEFAAAMAERCALPAPFVEDLRLAGELHDAGKADPRFQAMLREQPGVAAGSDLLAKSAIRAASRARRRRAQVAAGYPSGMRHEALSAALIDGADRLEARATDWDLVQHLVESHHGWARPFLPAVVDPAPREVELVVDGVVLTAHSGHALHRLDSAVSERHLRLQERYGWFRLAWLESMLRLADHRQSESEEAVLIRGGSR